jgi:hypothetical protein
VSDPRGKAGKWGPTTTTARGKRKQLGEALAMGALMQTQAKHDAEREAARKAAVERRALAVFDCYAGLRRLTFTREGALAKLRLLGVRQEEAEAAAAQYEPTPAAAGAVAEQRAVKPRGDDRCTSCGTPVAHTSDWTLWPWGDGAMLCSGCNEARHEKEEYQ